MKKMLALVLTLSMTAAMVGCGAAAEPAETTVVESSAAESVAAEESTEAAESTDAEESTAAETETAGTEAAAGEVMSYEEYMAAELDTQVVVETYVQAKQSWWEDKATLTPRTRMAHTLFMTWHVLKRIMRSLFPVQRYA